MQTNYKLMKVRYFTIICLIIFSQSTFAMNKIQNGDFANEPIPPWICTISSDAQCVYNGSSMELFDNNGIGEFQQTFITSPGYEYSLSFLTMNSDIDSNTLSYSVAQKEENVTFNQRNEWYEYSTNFIATDETTVLKFLFTTISGTGFLGVDDVEILEIGSSIQSTTPIEFSITSSAPGYEAFGINCDISLNSDDNCDTPVDLNNQQTVYVASSTIVGSQKVVTIGYASDEPNLTSMGFTLNFDSTALSLSSVDDVFAGAIAAGEVYDDGDNLSLAFGWASLFGGFPGANQVNLATVVFDIIGYEAPPMQNPIEFSITSSAVGYEAFGIDCDISLNSDDNCSTPGDLINQQAVYVASSTIVGSQKVVTIGYASDEPNTTGIGFDLTFDSSKLSFDNSLCYQISPKISIIACGDLYQDNALSFVFASLFSEFPGANEVILATLTFDIIGYDPPTQLEQIISVNNTPKGVLGRSSILEVVYDTSDNNNQLSGLGMRVHFNSSLLSFKEITDLIDQDIIVNGEGPFSDDANYDNDPLTDQYMLFGWASLYNNWPNRELPTVLMNMAFNVSDTIDIDVTPSTNINFTDSSFTAGYEFSANSYVLEFQRATWDFDGDGNADALTDGLMMIRYLFGLRAELVTFSAMSDNSTLSPEEVIAEIEAALDIMDIDADGEFNALTDGLLLLRYLFGLRDDSLTNGAVGADATRSSNVDIQNYLESHMPAN